MQLSFSKSFDLSLVEVALLHILEVPIFTRCIS